MTRYRHASDHARIAEVVSLVGPRALPLIDRHAGIDQIVRRMVDFPRCRLLYVVGEGNRLAGAISLGDLVRLVFAEMHEPKIHARGLVHTETSETAEHIMGRTILSATEEDAVEDVLQQLIDANVKEFPVVDTEGRVVADLTIVDLLGFLLEQQAD